LAPGGDSGTNLPVKFLYYVVGIGKCTVDAAISNDCMGYISSLLCFVVDENDSIADLVLI